MQNNQNNIINNLQTFIVQQINLKIKNIVQVKTVLGVAQSTEDKKGIVKVQLIGEIQSLDFSNKSGEFIDIGDIVVIEYKHSLTKGVIIRRLGCYKANGRLSVTQAEFDSMQTAGELKEGWVYDIIG